MDKNTIMDAMEHIDPRLIEDADCGVKPGRMFFNKGILIAACVCLLLTTAIAAGVFFATPEVKYHDDHHVSDVTGEVMDGFEPVLVKPTETSTKVSLDCFDEAFLQDVANKPENQLFLHFYFDVWSELEEYIGFNMFDNAVLDAKAEPWFFVHEDTETFGALQCTAIDGILTCARATARYNMNYTVVPSENPNIECNAPVGVFIEASVFTEHSPIAEENMFTSYYYADGTNFSEEMYTSPNGYSFRIIRVERSDSELTTFYGLLCLNNVYITVESTFIYEDVALSTLKEVLDGFVMA